MRYWRLLLVSFLLTFSIAGCRRKPQRALPPQHAQAPIISTMPPMPPLTLKAVQLEQPKPAPPVALQPAAAPPKKKRIAKARHHRTTSRPESESEATDSRSVTSGAAPSAPATALIGQLSADDSNATPNEAAQTKRLIDSTTVRLKKISTQQQTEHKDAVAQVNSFLAQARQALSMNDVVGAQTLANKAKIMVDELSK
ncbi:MAG: hypothetical protein ACLQMO_02845 [Acidobacteriaceae bacterium]